ncbi:Mitochondrial porin, variant 2 [Lathyrus oleraceus]|uniref:Mitochondrial porin, variant 2 n=1 Tax=Pisum sativum TaxID=3888 RepID=A0A9D5BKJ0_PEA|nr:Mitochondrial porin, variant 2 [Pisum sativum]
MITKPALEALKDRLMTENVAEEIAEKLCESVTASEEKPDDNTYSSVNSAISIEDSTLTSQVSTSSCQLRKNSLPQITSSILLELPFHFQKIILNRPAKIHYDNQEDIQPQAAAAVAATIAITSSRTKKGELFLGDVNTQLKNKNITTDIKADTNSNIFTTITVNEPAPGVKAILSFKVPEQTSGKVELQNLHEYAGISSSVGLKANPIVNFSSVIGTNALAFGADISFDTKLGELTKSNVAVNFVKDDLIGSFDSK